MPCTIESVLVNKENLTLFDETIRLFSTVEVVAEYNVAYLCRVGRPIDYIKAIHNCAEANKNREDEAGGLHLNHYSMCSHCIIFCHKCHYLIN